MSDIIDLESIKLPYIKENQTLIGPGVWNSNFYDSEELKSAYKRTDWGSKDICSLFLDHADKSVPDWVGFVRNPKVTEDGSVKGDLYVVDKPTAMKLAFGAKFGVSAKVAGLEENGSMKNFRFENFSVVINPACKMSYINNSQKEELKTNETVQILEFTEDELALVTAMESKRKEMGMSVSEFYAIPKDPPSESKLPIFDMAHCRNAMARWNQVSGVSAEEKASAKQKIIAKAKHLGIDASGFSGQEEKMAEEEVKPAEPVTEVKVAEVLSQEPVPTDNSHSHAVIVTEELASKKKPVEDELSEEELDAMVTDAQWSEFSLACKAKKPKMSFKEIAKALKSKKNLFASYESMGDEELSEVFSAVSGIREKRNPKLAQKEEPKDNVKLLSEIEAKEKEIESLKQTVKSLSEQPDRVTVKSLSAETNAHPEAPKYKNGDEAMASFLVKNIRIGGN